MRLIPMQFNNYFNRIVKRYNTIAEYINHAVNPTDIGPSMFLQYNGEPAIINFKPNDDVETKQVIDWEKDWTPDYLLVVADTTTDIVSRWFVTESKRTRGGQYLLNLRRDLIADNFEAFQESVALIQKGKPLSVEDVSIYNREDFNGNEIQKSESKIKDKTGSAWVVGYYEIGKHDSVTIEADTHSDIVVSNLSSWGEYNYCSENPSGISYKHPTKLDFRIGVTVSSGEYYNGYSYTTENTVERIETLHSYVAQMSNSYREQALEDIVSSKNTFSSYFYTYNTDYKSSDKNFDSYDGKIIYDSTASKYYKITVQKNYGDINISFSKNSSTENAINNYLVALGNTDWAYDPSALLKDANTKAYGEYVSSYLLMQDITSQITQVTATIPVTSKQLRDAPYKMFAIPYNSITVYSNNNYPSDPFNPPVTLISSTIIEEKVLEIVNAFNVHAQITFYDIQLLPYCPLPKQIYDAVDGANAIHLNGLTQDVDFAYILDSDSNEVGIILFPEYSSFTTTSMLDTYTPISDIENFKVANQFKKQRLVSPNYASSFEFKTTYINKRITMFNISCTYKPYNPYVNVRPYPIDNLYGKDFNNGFGLILQGDFSIPMMNDQWKNYQINNKNYLNAFNRSIESLDIRQEYERIQNIVGAVGGTISGAASGAMTGAGAAGAVIGGAVSGAAGAVDVAYGERMRADQKDLAIDNFNYNIANVKARPQTIAKVSAFDINNKIFPILETYDATDWEKETFKRKLKYTGYTINRVARIRDYYNNSTFIKGMIIKCEMLNDTHVLNALYDEFAKGVYANGPTI